MAAEKVRILLLTRLFIEEVKGMLLSSITINLLMFYNECRSLIGYATRYLFCNR